LRDRFKLGLEATNDEAHKDDQYHHIAVVGDRNYFVCNYQAFVFHANATSDARIYVAGYYRNNRSPDRRFTNLESGEGIRSGHSIGHFEGAT